MGHSSKLLQVKPPSPKTAEAREVAMPSVQLQHTGSVYIYITSYILYIILIVCISYIMYIHI